jgi:hypothetical protein
MRARISYISPSLIRLLFPPTYITMNRLARPAFLRTVLPPPPDLTGGWR